MSDEKALREERCLSIPDRPTPVLRSAAIDPQDPHRLRLFAGCGIVAASDPAAELAESEAKLEPMRHALASD